MIQCIALRKQYGELVAVQDLDLEVAAGEVFGFLGPNGAGKTTTIRMMVGLLEPTSGQVLLGGHDIASAPEAAKALLGYVPDQPFLYDKLTANELLRFIGGLYRVARGEIAPRSEDLLEEFGLIEHAEELIETFSHGMKQRLALAAALIHRPRILILDEPMVGMDPQGALALRQLLGGLAASGVAIFLSTHSLPVAEELCDRIGILDHGRLIAQGTLAELRAHAGEILGSARGSSLESVFLSLTRTAGRRT
ncbi:MAG: ABC transporter [Polyangiaceae bacterium UTPRO1]|jgi:ABC-2 type transport system ATP-binding protein|nr:ABC transporter ATP-binding protein [Myxococcales bacterium]OQY65967.1 MAG: ABC transporter [Polyangiaceae bacterium UTPRO1]